MSTVEMLVYLIQRGKITIERVAEQYKPEVNEVLQSTANTEE